MKVCRMCWALLDDQLERCNCVTGADSIFFKDVAEAINYFVKYERLKFRAANNLIKLTQDKLKDLKDQIRLLSYEEKTKTPQYAVIGTLESLLHDAINSKVLK